MQDKPKYTQVALRLPPEMHGALKEIAERERRSLHAQILTMLEEAIYDREREGDQAGKFAA
jgi:hypothetical protein